jgi:alpha-aminoadipic semialdehyde synthase
MLKPLKGFCNNHSKSLSEGELSMKHSIGIRIENKDQTERRAPLTPAHVKKVVAEYGVEVLLEPSPNRVFTEEEYRQAGAKITSDLNHCNIIFGVKEIPKENLAPGLTYCFFSHTIKAQPFNMPMLKKIMNLGVTLLDYELVKDKKGVRKIFFGNFAGYAGMINSLWALGQRLQWEGINTSLKKIKQAKQYESLNAAETAVKEVGEEIRRNGLPVSVTPLICGFTGYGRVSCGAQHIFDLLPVVQIPAGELAEFIKKGNFSSKTLYKVEFHERDMFAPKGDHAFELQDYFSHPGKYRGKFEQYVPFLTMIVNGIYWEPRCPRLVTKKYLREHFQTHKTPRLRVIGDISCDIDGSIEMTVKAANSANPLYVFDPRTEKIKDGWEGSGVVMMTVDKLPAELPREASDFFGNALLPFIPALAAANFTTPFEKLQLPEEFKNAIIVHKGQLTPPFEYLREHVETL